MEKHSQNTRTNSIGWMLQRLSRIAEETMEKNLESQKLTIQQFAILMTALEEAGLTQSEIGNRFAMPAYAISRSLDALQQAGLVERRPHPTSRRAFQIHPTKEGQMLRPVLMQAVSDTNGSLTAALSEAETAALSGLMKKILLDLSPA
jgi:DNA-binding MarR family transcriptional regulator